MNLLTRPSTQAETGIDTHSTWQARLDLGLDNTKRGTVLRHCRHKGPLYVQKPFYPEGPDLAHLYLLHPPGGMVSGDDLQISVSAAANAQGLVTTPGAGRIYRARPDRKLQKQHIQLNLAEYSTLEWLPLENIIYPDAHTDLSMDIQLAEGASIITWDISCFGLAASNKPFVSGTVSQQTQISMAGRLQLRERFYLDPHANSLMTDGAGLRGCSVNGLMIAGPFKDETAITGLIQQLAELCQQVSALAAVSLNHEFLQIRFLGHCSEATRLLFVRCWGLIRPYLMNRHACEPRIWAT